jgi:hypothetical protein
MAARNKGQGSSPWTGSSLKVYPFLPVTFVLRLDRMAVGTQHIALCNLCLQRFCDSRHKLAERALIAVLGILPKRNFPLKSFLRRTFLEEVTHLWIERAGQSTA